MDDIVLPELPDARRERFMTQYGISENHARTLTGDLKVANFYESVAEANPAIAAIWVADILLGEINYRSMRIDDVPTMNIADLIALIRDETITDKSGVEVLRVMLDQCMGEDVEACEMPADIVTRLGLTKAAGDDFTAVIEEVIAANPNAVADCHAGKKGAVNFLVGQVMKATRGRADPKELNIAMAAALRKTEE